MNNLLEQLIRLEQDAATPLPWVHYSNHPDLCNTLRNSLPEILRALAIARAVEQMGHELVLQRADEILAAQEQRCS